MTSTLPVMPLLVTTTEGKPPIPDWVPPEETKEDLPWASLHTLDLSLLDSSDPSVVRELQATCKQAIEQDGFLYLENFGISYDQMLRQFAIAQMCLVGDGITDLEREQLVWKPETGSFAGYKPRIGWGEKGRGAKDQIEHFNFYENAFEDPLQVPHKVRPYLDEVQAYASHIHNEVHRRLLVLLSRVLELPDNYLWDHCQTHGQRHHSSVGESYYRFQVYHPFDAEEAKTASLVMHGHTDYGTTTILASQPITCLQMLSNDGIWRYVKYEPHRLLVNLGDALEVISGGHFKATRHKVVKPPADQADYVRVALISFNTAPKAMVMAALRESPVIQREGTNETSEVYGAFMNRIYNGHQVPTFGEWRTSRSQNAQAPPEKVVEVNGRKFKEQVFKGVIVRMPI